MSENFLDYPRFIQEALRDGVVRRSLELVAREGLPVAHNFYITFRTDHPGVELAGSLKDVHPEQLTIVLEHQYRDLEVTADAFSVTLWFGGIAHGLKIPFEAILAFSDPAVNLQLIFPPLDELTDEEEEFGQEARPKAVVVAMDTDGLDTDGLDTDGAGGAEADDADADGADGNNVVSFAAFRDKGR